MSLIPKTVAWRLITLLIGVILLSQLVNLALIIGEGRIQSRNAEMRLAMQRMADHAQYVPDSMSRGRINLSQSAPLSGAFFVTDRNQEPEFENAGRMKRQERLLRLALEAKGLDPLAVFVIVRPHRPRHGPGAVGRRPRGDGSGPPPRPGERKLGNRPPERGSSPDRRRPGQLDQGGTPPIGAPNRKGIEIVMSAKLSPNMWFTAIVPATGSPAVPARLFITTGMLLFFTILAALWFSRHLSRPLSELAKAAEQLGRGEETKPLAETGPEDVVVAARAFNNMQTRLKRTIETQRSMLRAVGHDLRTPLTALRIRAENIPDEADKDKFISTIHDMTEMTEEILSWAKDASGEEALANVNLNAFLASISDDYVDQNKDVEFNEDVSTTLVLRCRRVAIKRAILNLINNALKYGKRARISVVQGIQHINIQIDDDGPGIPIGELENVLKPFVRLETSRSKETGGIGLGLSIVESIVQSHGGALVLENKDEGGLRATLKLPK